ncbi:MAG: BON domain-containing protein [Gemmatimonadetes bacterium]|nr:BON domain-containing protein [Gemmatimonadota bacterium]
MEEKSGSQGRIGSLALKIGIASAIGFGALATGLLISRQGRHLVKEAWQGRQRTRIEDRVLDRLWADPVLGRRDLDVDELGDGVIALYGKVRSDQERRVALALARLVMGAVDVEDHLMVAARDRTRRARERLERR